MLDYSIGLANHLGHWGYLVVFLVVMLECQALLGLFMPGESLVLVSGALAAGGVFDLDALIVTVAAAAIVGDSIGYELGRHLGQDWLRRYGARLGVHESHLETVSGYFHRHGGKSVLFSHFMHLLRALMPFLAGASRMRYLRFFFYNSLGCILWASVFSLLGYFIGGNWHLLGKWIGRAGDVVGALGLLIIGLVWLWHWAARHEVELRAQWQALVEQAWVAALRRRFAPQIRFLQDRLTPGGYLGLHLTVGATIIVLASWWFGGIAQDVLARDPLVIVDRRIALWFHQHATEAVTRLAMYITVTGSLAFLGTASLAAAMFFVWRREWYRVLTLALAMGGGSLLNLVLKQLFHRDRPVFEHPIITLTSYSFPSGHAMGATLFYGLAAIFLVTQLVSWRVRVLVFLGAFFLILLIGLTRIYLGVHYLSDVIGAIAAGLAWLAFCVTAVDTLRRRRSAGPPSRPRR